MTRKLGTDPSGRRPAPSGMLATVVQAGRHRRRRLAAAGGSSVAAIVIAIAGVASLGASHNDSLSTITPADGGDQRATVATSTSTPAGPDATASPGSQASASPSETPSTQPTSSSPAEGPAAQASDAPTQEARRGNGNNPVTRSSTQYGSVCTGSNSGVGGGTSGVSTAPWCITATVNTTVGIVLQLQVCRDPAHAAADLSFSDAQEVDYSLSNSQGTIWHWSTGQAFASSVHTLHFAAGDCFRWDTKWDGLDDEGRPVPARESLELTSHSTATELRRDSATASFTNP